MAGSAEVKHHATERHECMKDDDLDFTGIRPLHSFGEFVGSRASEYKPKVDIPEPPCVNCPHLHECSENQVACTDFALYVDKSYQKNPMVKHFMEASPRLPMQEVYDLIYKEED